jgi:hypothetical protein
MRCPQGFANDDEPETVWRSGRDILALYGFVAR